MAAQRSKSLKDSLKNVDKSFSAHKRFAISTSTASVHQEKGNGLKLKLKLKPNPTNERHSVSKIKTNVDTPFTEKQNSQSVNSCNLNSSDKIVGCCCCCTSSTCRSKCSSNDDETDTSLLREPLNLGKTDVKQILHCILNGTVEVKDIVLNECNIIYECRVCRNLFRSLANLLSHKRFHCTKHCCEKMILFDSTTFNYEEETISEQNSNVSHTSTDKSKSSTKECSAVDDTTSFHKYCAQKINVDKKRGRKSEFQFKLVKIPTNSNAVYQEIVNCKEPEDSNVIETTEDVPDCNEVPVQDDKSNNETSSVQSSFNESYLESVSVKRKRKTPSIPESTPLKIHSLRVTSQSLRVSPKSPEMKTPNKDASCNICSASFSSKKTLRVHMKTIHAVQRLIYPCPFCCMTFKQLSNGIRHMSQIHKKNKTQVKSLREVLRARAYPEVNDSPNAESDDSEDGDEEEDEEQESLEKSDT